MKKDDVISQYKALVRELGENAHNVVLSAGSASVMMGLRDETNDLDVDVLPGVFKWAATTKTVIEEEGFNPRVIYSEHIDLHILDEDRGKVCIEGVWTYSPRELVNQRREMVKNPKRNPDKLPQDHIEIALLEGLARSGNKFTAKAV
jgi:hypothetical protein